MPTVLRAKCVVVGDSTVGKSALCQGFHSDGSHFPKNYSMTTGVELLVKHVNIPDTKDSVELYMHDSAGKEVFYDLVQQFVKNKNRTSVLTKLPVPHEKIGVFSLPKHPVQVPYYRHLAGWALIGIPWDQPSVIMVVYDCTSEMSFSSCSKWIERIRSQKPEVKTPGVLVANKVDLDERRMVSKKAGQELASTHDLKYFECSAKEMQDVDAPFYYLANKFYELYQEKLKIFEKCS